MSRVAIDDRAGDGRDESRGNENGGVNPQSRPRTQEQARSDDPPRQTQDRSDPQHDEDRDDAPRNQQGGERGQPREKKPPIYRRPVFWIVVAVILVIGVVLACFWFFDWRYKVDTDDAFVTAHSTTVSARVAGHVVRVLVDDNQDVKKGDVLVELDDRDLLQAVKGAQASDENAQVQLAQANAQLAADQADVAEAQAGVVSAEASDKRAAADQERYRTLQTTDPRAVSQQQVDQANATARTTGAQTVSAKAKKVAAEAQVKVAQAQIIAAQAMIDKAKSDLDNAQLQLSYGMVHAAEDGQVTGRSVEVGNYITAGQALMSLVPRNVYVIGNYKETQLKNMRVGQPVQIHIDAYGVDLDGHVQSIQAGSGAAFSLLPPENATGNYVKVVQRIPVKITFDQSPPMRLAPGMSVEPTVETKGP